MAKIISEHGPEPYAPERNFERYTGGESGSGQTIYKADSGDFEDTAKVPDMSHCQGKPFHNVPCDWIVGPDDGIPTSADFATRTSITKYKLIHAAGTTYELRFWCKDTYDFRFHSVVGIWKTGRHKLCVTSRSPTIVGVSGS